MNVFYEDDDERFLNFHLFSTLTCCRKRTLNVLEMTIEAKMVIETENNSNQFWTIQHSVTMTGMKGKGKGERAKDV